MKNGSRYKVQGKKGMEHGAWSIEKKVKGLR
jgi:hypothetical protein